MQNPILRKPWGAKLTDNELRYAQMVQADLEAESGLPVYIMIHDTHTTIERPFGESVNNGGVRSK